MKGDRIGDVGRWNGTGMAMSTGGTTTGRKCRQMERQQEGRAVLLGKDGKAIGRKDSVTAKRWNGNRKKGSVTGISKKGNRKEGHFYWEKMERQHAERQRYWHKIERHRK